MEYPMFATRSEMARKRLEGFGLKPADHTDITAEILKMMNGRGENWPWVEKWIAEEAPKYVNNDETLVFEIPLANLAGQTALDFTQRIWMLQPSVFEYQTWNGRTFVRIWWEGRHGPATRKTSP